MRYAIVCAALMCLTGTGAAAQDLRASRLELRPAAIGGDAGLVPSPYGFSQRWQQRRAYDWCQARTERLRQFERRVRYDGRVSQDELRIANALRTDIAIQCGSRHLVQRRARWER